MSEDIKVLYSLPGGNVSETNPDDDSLSVIVEEASLDDELLSIASEDEFGLRSASLYYCRQWFYKPVKYLFPGGEASVHYAPEGLCYGVRYVGGACRKGVLVPWSSRRIGKSAWNMRQSLDRQQGWRQGEITAGFEVGFS